jgi:hypothetical protein
MSQQDSSPSGLLSAAVGAAACAGCPSPSTPEDRHRFYQCVLDSLHVTCKPIEKEAISNAPTGANTMIMPIESWIPPIADRAVIRWRLFEKRRLVFEEK